MGFFAKAAGQREGVPPTALPSGNSSAEAAQPVKRILVVEDDFIIAAELTASLREAGFEVLGPAATGDDAIRLAAAAKPHLVVMDIRLYGTRDGVDVALELYQSHGIRSIFATAHSDAQTIERGKAANPLDWVQKPYNPLAMVSRIKAIIGDETDRG